MASSGTNLQLLPCLFIVCTRAEAKQSKILLVLMFGICYVELPIVHSNFQSYILVFEVLPGKPVALPFICRNGGKFLLQPWLSQLVIVNAEHHQLELKSQRRIDGQLVQIRNWEVKLEEGNNKLNIFLHGTDMDFHLSSNTNALKLNLQHLKFTWPPHALSQTLDMSLTTTSIYGILFLTSPQMSSRILMLQSNADYICSHMEENWKLNLLAENLSCVQIGIIVFVVGDQCRSRGEELRPRPLLSFKFSQYIKGDSTLVTHASLMVWCCQSGLQWIHKWPRPPQEYFKNYQHTVLHLGCKQLFTREKWKSCVVANYDYKELVQLKTPWVLFACSNCVHCCLARNLITDTVISRIASGPLLEVLKFQSSNLFIGNTKASMVLLESARRRILIIGETDILAKIKKIFNGVLWTSILKVQRVILSDPGNRLGDKLNF